MFANSEIGREFVLEAYKLKKFIDDGLVEDVIKNELRNISKGKYESFYTNSVSIDLYEGKNSIFELRLLRSDRRTETLSTTPNEIFVFPITPNVIITEYSISGDGAITGSNSWEMETTPHFMGSTSSTNKFYDFSPKDGKAILLFGASKKIVDDIYINYCRHTENLIEIISTDITESRLEFWMSFYADLSSNMTKKRVEELYSTCRTRKLKGFLSNEQRQ